jgi:hypothetical protein
MSDPSDWEPLPDDLRVAHPGELAAAAPVVPAPAPVPAAPATVPPPAPDPEAEAALQRLRQRLAAAPPATSFVAAVQHRELRDRRRRAAAQAPFVAAAKVVQSSLTGPEDVPLPIELAPPLDRDPREDEDWFRGLPEPERQRLHATWADRRAQGDGDRRVQRRNRNRRSVAAVLIAVVVALLGSGVAWQATIGAGGLCAVWWRHVAPDRFRDPILAVTCLFVAHVVAMIAHGHMTQGLYMDAILQVALAAIVGFDGEIRRSGGFDAI